MNELDTILEECLDQFMNGASTLDECLARHPEHAAQLRPLLMAALRAQEGRVVTPSPAFRARTRAQLMQHAQAHPRSKPGTVFWRVAVSMVAVVMGFLVTGTAYAQRALPGEALYHWKLTSEHVWRSVSPDPLGVDLGLANRRVDEMVAVAGDEVRVVEALDGYKALLIQFQSDPTVSHQNRIAPVLASHRDTLAQAGLLIPELDNYAVMDNQVDQNTSPDQNTPLTPDPASH